MTERDNHTGRYASKPQSPLNETPRPSRKRAEEPRREIARTRRPRPETAETRPGTARSERDGSAERARAQRRRRRRLRRRVYRVLLAVLAVVLVLSAAMIARGALKGDGLKGSWALEEGTVYEFDGKGGGTLRLPMGSHDFSYTTEQNLLTLDFAEDSATDSSYSFSVDGKSLTLDTNTGTVYRLTRR